MKQIAPYIALFIVMALAFHFLPPVPVQAQAPIAPIVNLVALSPVLDVFHGGVGAQNSYTLSKQPTGNVMVFLNGLLQVAPDDYTLTGTSLTFTITVDTPIVQVLYWAQ